MQWGALGDARAALLGPLRGFLQLSPTKSAVFPPTFAMLTPRDVILTLIIMDFSICWLILGPPGPYFLMLFLYTTFALLFLLFFPQISET